MAIQSLLVSQANFDGGSNQIFYDWDDVTMRIEGVRLEVTGTPVPLHDVTCDQFNPSGQLMRTLTLPNNQNGTFFDTNLSGNNIELDPFEKDGVTPRDPPRILVEGGWGLRIRWSRQ